MNPETTNLEKQQMTDTAGTSDTLSVIDNRTGESYEIPIIDGAVRSLDLRQIKVSPEDFGLDRASAPRRR